MIFKIEWLKTVVSTKIFSINDHCQAAPHTGLDANMILGRRWVVKIEHGKGKGTLWAGSPPALHLIVL
jgi:hypothetical protein